MSSAAKNTLIGVVIVVVLALLGYFAWQEKQASEAPAAMATSTSATTSTSTGETITISSSTEATTTGGYTITPITASNAPTPPNYKTPLSYPSSMSADEQSQYQSEFATVQTTLASSPTDWGSWIQLGILRQDTGDYTGAKADWTYVTEIYPSDPTAFADLGNLYATYLNEPTQAIAEYKDAIKLDPTKEVSFYQNLAQVYVSEGDTADAKAILQQGITAQVDGYQQLQTQLDSM